MRVVETVPTHLTSISSHHSNQQNQQNQQTQPNLNFTSLQNSSPVQIQQNQTISQPSLDIALTTTIGPFSPPEQPSKCFNSHVELFKLKRFLIHFLFLLRNSCITISTFTTLIIASTDNNNTNNCISIFTFTTCCADNKK